MWWLIGAAVVYFIIAFAKNDYNDKTGDGQKKYCSNCKYCNFKKRMFKSYKHKNHRNSI